REVHLFGLVPGTGRADPEAAAALVVQQGTEHAGRVEPGVAEPVDRAIGRHQRSGLQISDESVLGDCHLSHDRSPSGSGPGTPAAEGPVRHPAEIPFYVFMVALNVIIIAVIIRFALVLPFVPARLQEAWWAITIRSAFVGLLLVIPGLIVVRETQRAATRGTAV